MNELNNRPHIICLTGLSGCGKTTTKDIFSTYIGVKTFYTKDLHEIILGSQVVNLNKMDISTLLPNKNDFIKRIMSYISKTIKDEKVIVLDSIRSTSELEYIENLLEYKTVSLIRITCDENIRIGRLKKRDHSDEITVYKRDLRDIGEDGTNMFNMKELFKIANFTIDTSGTFNDIQQQIFNILSQLIDLPKRSNIMVDKIYSSNGNRGR